MWSALDRCLEALREIVSSNDPQGRVVAESVIDDYLAAVGPDGLSQAAALNELDRSVREMLPEPAASQIISSVDSRKRRIEQL